MNDSEENQAALRRIADQATLPFRILEELKIPSGYERSFKMLPGAVLANRYMLGVDLKHLTRDHLLDIGARLNMPVEYAEAICDHLPNANLVFFGFEHDPPDATYRVYLEYWDKVKSEVQSDPTNVTPRRLHLGFKWNVDDNRQRTISQYVCFPLLSSVGIRERVAKIYASRPAAASQDVALEIIGLADQNAEDSAFIYLEVAEPDNSRSSFDVNLYNAALRVKQVWPALERLQRRFSIPADSLERLLHLVGDKTLGHLSSGYSSNGQEFLTIYYEANES